MIKLMQSGHSDQLITDCTYVFFCDLHLQVIESISPKASVENSSTQWAIWLNRIIVLWYQSSILTTNMYLSGGPLTMKFGYCITGSELHTFGHYTCGLLQ